ncbi:MAG: hypothetical protein NVSMB9_18690 [Isosphaeraceae bacterium]
MDQGADRSASTYAQEQGEPEARTPRWCLPAVVLAALIGLCLMGDSALALSATYDEVAYLRVAARWWRTGDQNEITRMGSPLTFWKVQQGPVLWILDRLGHRELADGPEVHQARLLPLARWGALWIWVVAFGITVYWSRLLHGPRAMALTAWLFALSPNLLAHGSLVTMELPLVACTSAVFFFYWKYLKNGRALDFLASASLAGLAFSCKFTAILLPILLGLVLGIDLWRTRRSGLLRIIQSVLIRSVGFVAVMLVADLLVTGFARLPLSQSAGRGHPSVEGRHFPTAWARGLVSRALETPIPQDWVGFLTQLHHQRSGGPSYLLGERRMRGWSYYYLVALAVKVPLTFSLLMATRALVGPRAGNQHDWSVPVTIAAYLLITAMGSTRNYGFRYLLPLSPLALVWVSSLAEWRGWPRTVAFVGLAGQALGVASVHPNELTYFNALAGGPLGGRSILSDSNLDWGQGLKAFQRLQRDHEELKDVTLYYFGDTHPRYYGVSGVCHVIDAVGSAPAPPPRFEASTRFVAVSTSLQWGPWGPPGYFRALKSVRPAFTTSDSTISVYRSADVFRPRGLYSSVAQ